MANYTLTTAFLAKDSLVSGNPLKLVKGADFQTEFTAVQTAIATKPDGSVVYFPDGNAAQPSVGFTNNAGTGMYNTAGVLGFATGNTQRLSISANGNVVVTVPVSGTALVLNAFTGQGALTVNAAATSTAGYIGFQQATAAKSFIGVDGGNTLATGSSSGDFVIRSDSGGAIRLSTNAGSTSSVVLSSSGVLQAIDDGSTLQTVGWRDVPQNSQGGNYTTVLADRGKHIQATGAGNWTYTIDNSVAYPIGTVITFINDSAANVSIALSSGTLSLAGTATTGTRTLSVNGGIATAIKTQATVWRISGTGLS